MLTHNYRMKWWGWGRSEISFDLRHRQGIVEYLQKRFNVKDVVYGEAFNWRDIKIDATTISTELLAEFNAALGDEAVCIDDYERILHSFGKSYRDAIRIRSLKIDRAPDVILYPSSRHDLEKIILICEERKILVVPFGGGTSVVAGVESLPSAGVIACVDMARMNKITAINETAMYASVEAGKFGPELEKELNEKGYTLGHFPQSFEFSTVGGWVATRSAGQNSTYYGKIEDLTIGLEIVTPKGVVNIPAQTHKACGPDIKNIIVGSEGALGIISEAHLKIAKAPSEKKYVAYFFDSFVNATSAARELIQNGIVPAMIRVSDEEETESMIQLNSKPEKFSKKLIYAIGNAYMNNYGFTKDTRVLMMVGFEGESKKNKKMKITVDAIFKKYKKLFVGASIGKSWLKDRFFLPYLRDDFLNNHILIDTLETSATWDKINDLHQKVINTIANTFSTQGVNYSVFAHLSHLYKEGASLYFTFVANQLIGRELEQWEQIKKSASEAIIAFGAPISHHHGIGVDHKLFLDRSVSTLENDTLKAIKNCYDPSGIMNPGKLI
ncbi:MAG: FAD-binding oxidoreductase [Deltaproteobacteria bacterium]